MLSITNSRSTRFSLVIDKQVLLARRTSFVVVVIGTYLNEEPDLRKDVKVCECVCVNVLWWCAKEGKEVRPDLGHQRIAVLL